MATTTREWWGTLMARRDAAARALADLADSLRSCPALETMGDAQLVRSTLGLPDHSVSDPEVSAALGRYLAPVTQASSQATGAAAQLARQSEQAAARLVRAEGGVVAADVPAHARRISTDDEIGTLVLITTGGRVRAVGPPALERGQISGDLLPRAWYSAACIARHDALWRAREQEREQERQAIAREAQAERQRRYEESGEPSYQERQIAALQRRVRYLESRAGGEA